MVNTSLPDFITIILLTVFPIIQTERFLLREIVKGDQQKIYEGLSHPDVIKHYGISYNSFEATAGQLEWFNNIYREKTGIWWGISSRHSTELIGACGFNNISFEHFNAQIGYWLLSAYWRQGILAEIIPQLIRHAFDELHLHKIIAEVEVENIPSKKVLLKFGFQYEGTLKECEFKNGKFIDLEYYGLIV